MFSLSCGDTAKFTTTFLIKSIALYRNKEKRSFHQKYASRIKMIKVLSIARVARETLDKEKEK